MTVPQPLSFMTFLKRTASYLGRMSLSLGPSGICSDQIEAVDFAQKFHGDATQNVLCIPWWLHEGTVFFNDVDLAQWAKDGVAPLRLLLFSL